MDERLVFTACLLAALTIASSNALEPCPGDTRGDKRCNFDSTHRVCAKIGVAGTSFWKFTGQTSWCMTRGSYQGPNGYDLRCPTHEPTWCICKWATARWIKGQGCDDSIQFNCEATDVCNLKRSFTDYRVNLKPAHDCVKIKCAKQWNACPKGDGKLTVDVLHSKYWEIFPNYNQDGAMHLLAAYIIDRAHTLTESEIYKVFGGYCPVTGYKIQPTTRNLWMDLKVKKASDTSVTVDSKAYICCWPCLCDIQRYARVDTMDIRTKNGVRTFNVLVIGDPCVAGVTGKIPSSATSVKCRNNQLQGAKRSTNGHIVISMVQKPGKYSWKRASWAKSWCVGREKNREDYNMGKAFVDVAALNPIS